MRSSTLVVCALLGMTSTACLAQTASPDPSTGAHAWTPRSMKASNIVPADTGPGVAPMLPPSPAGDDAAPRDYLRAARGSLAADRTGEAQQSLEMAETRILPRSVPANQANSPDPDPAVAQIQNALHALGMGDTGRAGQIVDAMNR
jgi:hypothetical protein